MEKKFIVSEKSLRKNPDGTYMLLVEPTDRYIPSEYTAISPLDGRYSSIGKKLSPYFSEFALVKNRVKVEVLWLKYLLDRLSDKSSAVLANVRKKLNSVNLDAIYEQFCFDDFFEVKEIEAVNNHDVKACEVWVAMKVEKLGFPELKSYVHIGCTSEDITNPSYARMIKDSLKDIWAPAAINSIKLIEDVAKRYKSVAAPALTHGQRATPTTVGKKMVVYADRLRHAYNRVMTIGTFAKFNGATGNYSAISIAFPEENWPELSEDFVEEYLGLDFNPISTQIESHDYITEICGEMQQFNRILANFCMDMWSYISRDYFRQITVKEEVGSSTMPHKVNPINFENGESNLRKSTADLEFLREWLMSSRMERDLRDSTALRNIGTAMGHSLLGIERTVKGLLKVEVNYEILSSELNGKYEVLAEAIQTILRKYGIPDAYDQLKQITRGQDVTKEALHKFILSDQISAVISPEEKEMLLNLKPEDYVGLASQIVDDYFDLVELAS